MKVSIITPSFNQVNFLEKTIRSVLTQKGSFDLEYIIMDGGSTDGSIALIQKYAEAIEKKAFPIACKSTQLIWKSETDQGQSDAINKGLKLATGDIIGWLNSDDIYLSNALETVIRFFANQPETMWAFGKCHIIDQNDQFIRKWITAYKNLRLKNYTYNKLLEENFISQPAVFWRKNAMQKAGLLDEKHQLVMDYEYWLRLGSLFKGGFINAYLASFRWYPHSKSGSNFYQQFQQDLAVAKKYAQGNFWPIFLHILNHYKIISIYSILRFFRKK